jgi:hypothetical protein
VPDDGREQTRFYPPRVQLLLMAVGSMVLVAVAYLASMSAMTWLSVLGWIGVVVFAATTAVLLARGLRPGPTVVLNAEGIFDRTTLAPTGLIRWEDITVVRKREIGRGRGSERLLEVVLEDPDAFYARPRTPMRRVADGYRRALKHADVSIPGSMVSGPIQTVIDELQRWRPQLQVLDLPPQLPRMRLIKRGATRQHPRPPRW